MFSEKGVPHVYLPDHVVNMVFLQSGTPGDWALGEFWGPLANETRAWLDHLAMGKPCVLATPLEARATLEATLAIEYSMATGNSVKLLSSLASAPFPKFVIHCGTLSHELRKQRCTSKYMILVPLFDLKFLNELAASAVGTSNRRH